MGAAKWLATILKIAPLAIYLRAACCKLDIPVLGCDEPACPLALGPPEPGQVYDCAPSGNTAELKAWCAHGWTPWLNGLLKMYKIDYTATCVEESGYQLLKVFGAMEIVGYILLWVMPVLGATWLTFFMGFGLHFHLRHLKDPAAGLLLQFGLFCSSFLVLWLEWYEHENAAAPNVRPPKAPRKAEKAD